MMQMIFRSMPIYVWSFTIWCLSKAFQFAFSHEKTIWELIWEKSMILCDYSEFKLFIFGIFIISSIVNTIFVSIFSFFDFTQWPTFIRKYKVNPKTNEPPDLKKFRESTSCSSFNGFTIVIPSLIGIFYGLQWRGIPNIHTLPNVQTVLISCFIMDHILDIGAYTFHRILHHRLIYKYIHKRHHEYVSTIAGAVFHVHPMEQFMVSTIPLAFTMIIMRCHIAIMWISLTFFGISSIIYHSGYHLPFLNSPEFHDFHHVRFDCNYSTYGLMDWIFGTDKLFKNTIYEKRDIFLLSSKSVHELYPLERNKTK